MYNFGFTSMKITYFIFLYLSIQLSSLGQMRDTLLNIQTRDKEKMVIGGQIALMGSTLISLDKIWYKNYPKSSFHFYNDAGEWLDMDKAGHTFSTYQWSRVSYSSWKWAGLSDRSSILLSSVTGLGYQTIIETLDGYSQKWGWSWSDMAANTAGTSLWATQQLIWKKQKIKLKFSEHINRSNDPILQTRMNSLYGSSFGERLIKDYNAQTYWLSANVHDFKPNWPMPKWLNIAVGYGAEKMYGGFGNSWTASGVYIDRSDIKRYTQWYLSLDVDFEKIPTKNKFTRTLFYLLNTLKFPAPSLIYSNGKISSQWLYY